MSEPASALNGVAFDGLARVEECGLQGMITLRGDLSAKPVQKAVTAATGGKMPDLRAVQTGATGTACWMSPDEVLVLVDHAKADAQAEAMREALGKAHALAVNVSDARAMFTVSGPNARDVMAKLCPVDFSPEAFRPGTIRRTRLAQVAAAVWLEAEDRFRIVCFRSVADYAFNTLKVAANPASAVGAF